MTTLPIRISTAPPSLSDTDAREMSFYCDLHETQDWSVYEISRAVPPDVQGLLARPETVTYLVRMSGDKEIGLLFCHEDDEEWVMYCAVDGAGNVTREPAANEALWKVANAAFRLPDGHRLARATEKH